MPDEIWLPVEGFDAYEVSNLGRVRRAPVILALRPDKKGYLYADLSSHRKKTKCFVSRLVARAFIGPRPEGQVVRHRNGINDQNDAGNLLYGTRAQNEADKIAHGTALFGERHHRSKLTAIQVIAIRQRYKPHDSVDGENALAKEFGISAVAVHAILTRKTWKSVAENASDVKPRSRLTSKQEKQICDRYVRGSRTDGTNAIARDLGITGAAVHYVIKRAAKDTL